MLLNPTHESSSLSESQACSQLVRDIKNRDIAALETLYDKYSALLYGKLVAELGDRQLAETICKTVFVRTWREIDRYEHAKCRLFTWLIQLARQEITARCPK